LNFRFQVALHLAASHGVVQSSETGLLPSRLTSRCGANLARVWQARPESGLGVQEKLLSAFKLFPLRSEADPQTLFPFRLEGDPQTLFRPANAIPSSLGSGPTKWPARLTLGLFQLPMVWSMLACFYCFYTVPF